MSKRRILDGLLLLTTAMPLGNTNRQPPSLASWQVGSQHIFGSPETCHLQHPIIIVEIFWSWFKNNSQDKGQIKFSSIHSLNLGLNISYSYNWKYVVRIISVIITYLFYELTHQSLLVPGSLSYFFSYSHRNPNVPPQSNWKR